MYERLTFARGDLQMGNNDTLREIAGILNDKGAKLPPECLTAVLDMLRAGCGETGGSPVEQASERRKVEQWAAKHSETLAKAGQTVHSFSEDFARAQRVRPTIKASEIIGGR